MTQMHKPTGMWHFASAAICALLLTGCGGGEDAANATVVSLQAVAHVAIFMR